MLFAKTREHTKILSDPNGGHTREKLVVTTLKNPGHSQQTTEVKEMYLTKNKT
jgi:hypothetical protein